MFFFFSSNCFFFFKQERKLNSVQNSILPDRCVLRSSLSVLLNIHTGVVEPVCSRETDTELPAFRFQTMFAVALCPLLPLSARCGGSELREQPFT